MTEVYAYAVKKRMPSFSSIYMLISQLYSDKAKIEFDRVLVNTKAERARVLAVMTALNNAYETKHLIDGNTLYVHTKQKFNRKGLIVKDHWSRFSLQIVHDLERALSRKDIKVKYVKMK